MIILDEETNVPVFIDGDIRWPLVHNIGAIVQQIQVGSVQAGDDEAMKGMQQFTNFALNIENHESGDFQLKMTTFIYRWLKDNIDYLSNQYDYEVVSEMTEDNIFGIIYHDPTSEADTMDVYIMNDFTPKMYAHRHSSDISKQLQEFCFYEEHFWSLIEPIFNTFYYWFGAGNVSRKIRGEFRRLYRPGLILIEGMNRNPGRMPKADYISSTALAFNYVHIKTGVKEIFGRTEGKDEIIIEDGIRSDGKIDLFETFESHNLAAVYTYASFQKLKVVHRDSGNFKFQHEHEMPLDWYTKEDDLRFQLFKGEIWDNDLGSPIDNNRIVDILNDFHYKEKEEIIDSEDTIAKLTADLEDVTNLYEREKQHRVLDAEYIKDLHADIDRLGLTIDDLEQDMWDGGLQSDT